MERECFYRTSPLPESDSCDRSSFASDRNSVLSCRLAARLGLLRTRKFSLYHSSGSPRSSCPFTCMKYDYVYDCVGLCARLLATQLVASRVSRSSQPAQLLLEEEEEKTVFETPKRLTNPA